MLNLPYKCLKWELNMKRPMKVLRKIKFSEIDCSEQSRPKICEVLLEIL